MTPNDLEKHPLDIQTFAASGLILISGLNASASSTVTHATQPLYGVPRCAIELVRPAFWLHVVWSRPHTRVGIVANRIANLENIVKSCHLQDCLVCTGIGNKGRKYIVVSFDQTAIQNTLIELNMKGPICSSSSPFIILQSGPLLKRPCVTLESGLLLNEPVVFSSPLRY